MPKKVLLCSPKGVPGGISQWTENILACAAGDSSSVVLEWFYPELKESGGISPTSFLKRLSRGLRTYIPFITALRKRISENSYDVAHFATSGGLSFLRDYLALKACKKRGINTVVHLHFGRMPQILANGGWEKKLFERIIPYTDRFVPIDNPSYTALTGHGLNNAVNIPNPLSPKVAKLVAAVPDTVRDSRSVLFVGHVIPTKGVGELVDACSRIEDVKLTLLGLYDEETKTDILNRIPESARDRITFMGNRPLEDVIAAMKKCSVFVLPSYTEGFPNVIIESMACACPIIATPVGAIPDMLDANGNACGIIVPVKDTDALEKAIKEVIHNPEAAAEMGERAKRRVEELYYIDKVWTQLKELWLE